MKFNAMRNFNFLSFILNLSKDVYLICLLICSQRMNVMAPELLEQLV